MNFKKIAYTSFKILKKLICNSRKVIIMICETHEFSISDKNVGIYG